MFCSPFAGSFWTRPVCEFPLRYVEYCRCILLCCASLFLVFFLAGLLAVTCSPDFIVQIECCARLPKSLLRLPSLHYILPAPFAVTGLRSALVRQTSSANWALVVSQQAGGSFIGSFGSSLALSSTKLLPPPHSHAGYQPYRDRAVRFPRDNNNGNNGLHAHHLHLRVDKDLGVQPHVG